jgi:hypothetical protein
MHPWSVFSVFTPSMPSSPSCLRSPVFCSKNDALTLTKKLCFQVLQLKCHLFHKLVILLCYYSLTAHLSILLSQTQEMGVFAHLVWKCFWYWVSGSKWFYCMPSYFMYTAEVYWLLFSDAVINVWHTQLKWKIYSSIYYFVLILMVSWAVLWLPNFEPSP